MKELITQADPQKEADRYLLLFSNKMTMTLQNGRLQVVF